MSYIYGIIKIAVYGENKLLDSGTMYHKAELRDRDVTYYKIKNMIKNNGFQDFGYATEQRNRSIIYDK